MGWVVSSWRTERLAALLDGETRRAAAEIIRAAERKARRLARASARESADAAAYLEVLERLGEETRAAVRAQRLELRAGRPRPAEAEAARDEDVAADDPRLPEVVSPADDGEGEIRVARGGRRSRASLRDSPLTELFRATVTP